MSFMSRPSGSLRDFVAAEVLPVDEDPARFSTSEQLVAERRQRDEADLYDFARDAAADKHADKRHEAKPQPLKGPYRERLASLIVRGPRQGETFAQRLAKYAACSLAADSLSCLAC